VVQRGITPARVGQHDLPTDVVAPTARQAGARTSTGAPLENKNVKAAIAEAEGRLNGCGRLVVRASGTEPLIRIMAEGDDEKLVRQLVRDIAGAVKAAAE